MFNEILTLVLSIANVSQNIDTPDPVIVKSSQLLRSRQPFEACNAIAQDLNFNQGLCTGTLQKDNVLQHLTPNNQAFKKLHLLGVSLTQLGEFEVARSILDFAAQQASSIQKNEIELSLGNLDEATYQKNLGQLLSTDNAITKLSSLRVTIDSVQNCLKRYLDLGSTDNLSLQLKAKINWLLLFSKLDNNISELSAIQQQEFKYVTIIITEIKKLIPQSEKAAVLENRLKFTAALIQLSNLNPQFLSEAQIQASDSLSLASVEGNGRDVSKALGLTGQINLKNNSLNDAQSNFTKAVNIAKVFHASDLAYQWEWELAKIAVKNGIRDIALQHYKSTIDQLDMVRRKLLPLPSVLQLSFLDQVEPIYKEYLALLFDDKNPDLKSIVRINEKLQIAELENYLQCGISLDLTSILDLKTDLSPEVAIYLIKLPDKFEIIARLKDGTLIHHAANKIIIDETVYVIKASLQSDKFQNYSNFEFQRLFAKLYDQIIVPIKNKIASKGTIVFSVDSNLQNIPWSLLYDGDQYLLEKYSISLTLGSKVNLKGLKKANSFKPFIAGLINSPSLDYPDIPYVQQEINNIKELFPRSKFILDHDFTAQNLFRESQSFSIVHIASHGEFSSDPRKTYIRNWNGLLKLGDLQQLVRSRSSPIELLILSACATATGDRRSALGLAGATVQSGALSALGTLWRVDDESQALLMREFYSNLLDGNSKAEALRLAQLHLLKNHWTPFFWAAPVLIGDYL
ncbi:MAG: CHAT domain-containing protein [Thermosynechococcaceae cyanobacterium]